MIRILASLLAALLLTGPVAAQNRLLPEIQPTLDRLHELDRPYALPVVAREVAAPVSGRLLFVDLPENLRIHPSYAATVELCREFDPYDADDDEVSDARIRRYLETLADMTPLQEAFRVTRRGLEDLQAIWFRRGRGFEHVICGEVGGRKQDRLGGYHFWYAHYVYEREGSARYLGADYFRTPVEVGADDRGIVTGKFTRDPDGEGGHSPLPKVPVGGFTIGNSVAAMLAAGHIAYYGAMGSRIRANLNGKSYPWTFHRSWRNRASSVRTLWPRFVPGPSTYGR